MSTSPATSPSTDLLLEARGVGRSFKMGDRQIEILRGVDFTLARGEFAALRGASGAGKSTLLHLLGALDMPTSGTILFDGQDLSRLSDSALAKLRNERVGFVFQAYHLLPELDAWENVCIPARLARKPWAKARQRARELLTRVGLEHRLEHRPAELSGGEQQRVAIARALMNAPELVLADEPTGNLDSHTGEGIIDLLCTLQREENTTLLIATHDPKVAARAPRSVNVVDGAIEAD